METAAGADVAEAAAQRGKGLGGGPLPLRLPRRLRGGWRQPRSSAGRTRAAIARGGGGGAASTGAAAEAAAGRGRWGRPEGSGKDCYWGAAAAAAAVSGNGGGIGLAGRAR